MDGGRRSELTASSGAWHQLTTPRSAVEAADAGQTLLEIAVVERINRHLLAFRRCVYEAAAAEIDRNMVAVPACVEEQQIARRRVRQVNCLRGLLLRDRFARNRQARALIRVVRKTAAVETRWRLAAIAVTRTDHLLRNRGGTRRVR